MAQNQPEKKDQPVKSLVALREEEILSFWKKAGIYEKTLKKTEGNDEFVFYDGPPFATGQPHYGHILPGTIKDVIPRFKTMQGKHVPRQWGWDCHGLPIENLVEKELGLKSKKDILDYGVEKFNKAARATVMRYAEDWKTIIPRTGRFVNMEDDYKTMDTTYTESVWWSFKTMYDKGLVYEGFKSMQICPRCETTLSNFEVNQGYKDITDITVYAKFRLKAEANTFFLAWTTTPWTLPGNAALAVNPKIEYVKVLVEEESVQDGTKKISYVILAKSRLANLQALTKKEYPIVSEYKGNDLVGIEYEPIFPYYQHADLGHEGALRKKNGWKVYAADFVTTEDGTGIVHIAPAFGADDLELGEREKLPFIQHVSFDGRFKPEVTDFAGQHVKPKDTEEDPNAHQKADIEIVKYLAHHGALFAKEKIVHSYPHCWRCDTPLLNYATSSWFIKVTSIRDDLVAVNKEVNWIPANIKEGRFGKWLEGAKDWAVSRSRFWGAPIPVWRCEKCKKVETFGSISEVKEKIPRRNTFFVMRHGEAESNRKGVVGSDPHSFDLTSEGKKQAEAAAQILKDKHIDLIITSPFNRTEHTAEIVREILGLDKSQLIEDSRLQEIKAGSFNGKPLDEYHGYFSTYEERFTKAPPQGENQNDIRKRVGDFLYEINEKHQGKNILIVSHDTPIWLIFADAQGLDQKQTVKFHSGIQSFFKTAEVRKLDFVPFPHDELYQTDLHRPYIDGVTFACTCGGEMVRVPEVFDTWYDSGSMPYASKHYPFENLDSFNPKSIPFLKKSIGFPANFIAEGLDQTRGWFYTLLVLSMGLFDKAPYENVVVNGLVLAEDGKKMAKRLKNYPEITLIFDKYGADALRYFLMSSPAVHAEDLNFSEKGVDEVYKKLILRLQNVVSFYEMYAGGDVLGVLPKIQNPLDKWILARLAQVIEEVTRSLEAYVIDRAAWPLEGFIDDLSTWYLRRSRDRFKGDDEEDKDAALAVTRFVLKEFAKVCAPFMPFIAEHVYLQVCFAGNPESVHLEDWPVAQKYDEKILEEMKEVRKIVSLGLEARAKVNLKVRQPLRELRIKKGKNTIGLSDSLLELIKDEVNVKRVVYTETLATEVELDTVIDAELKEEGQVRELLRAIQDLRKKENLTVSDSAVLIVDTSDQGKDLIQKNKNELSKNASLSSVEWGSLESEEIKIDNLAFKLSIRLT